MNEFRDTRIRVIFGSEFGSYSFLKKKEKERKFKITNELRFLSTGRVDRA